MSIQTDKMKGQKVIYCGLLWLFAFSYHHIQTVEGRNSPIPENVEDIESGKGIGWEGYQM